MKLDSIISLKEAQNKKKMDKNNFYRWIEREKIPLYFKVPEGKNTFVASRKYLDLLARGASSDELLFNNLSGGIEQAELALGIVWLNIPLNAYMTLFASRACRLHYFFEGLQLSEDGVKSVIPRFVQKFPFGLKPSLFDEIYCLTNTFISPLPAQDISLEEVFISLEALRLAPKNLANLELPTYRYASKKLEIALQVWSDNWKKDYTQLNDKSITDRQTIDKNNEKARVAAKIELKNLYHSDGFVGEKPKTLHIDISKIIHPDFSSIDPNHWFDTPISRAIVAMIDASNHFWADLTEKKYGDGFDRLDIVNYLMQEHSLNKSTAGSATQVIQPENIKRGRR